LRIPIPTTKKEDKENIIKSYKNISILYNKLKNVFPKIEKIEANVEPFYILYEYFSDNVFEYIAKKCENERCHREAFYNIVGKINGRFCKKHKEEDMIDLTDTIFKNIIDQCIDIINLVYDKKIRCFDIKPNNFVLKFDNDNKPIVKMIDIDDCFTFDDKITDEYKNLLLLMSFYQFYIVFKNNMINCEEKNKLLTYIITKIKENTAFFNSTNKNNYETIFNKIKNDKENDYYNHYHNLNYYVNDTDTTQSVSFDLHIWKNLGHDSEKIIEKIIENAKQNVINVKKEKDGKRKSTRRQRSKRKSTKRQRSKRKSTKKQRSKRKSKKI